MFLASNLKKPKENQCFWLRTLKKLRKMNVFAIPKHLVTLGAPLGQNDTREAAERQQDTREAAKRHQRGCREAARHQRGSKEVLCEVD